jgi:hypothetical protein
MHDGNVAKMLPREWDNFVADFETLEKKLKVREETENMVPQALYSTWRRESVLILPPRVFLWRDEFEKAYRDDFSKDRITYLAERPFDREPNVQPFVPNDLIESVYEGFAACTSFLVRRWPWGDYDTKLLRKLAEAAQRFWVIYDPTDPTRAPTNKQVSDWLESQSVSNRIAENMASILRADGLPTGPRK